MERFLGTLYDVEETINTEQRNYQAEHEAQSPDVEPLLQSPLPYQQISSPSQSVPSPSQADPSSTPVYNRPKKGKKRPILDIDEAQNKISQTLDTLNQVLKDKNTHTSEKNEDECDLYAKLLAKRLRKYPESMRGRIMYQIDGLFLQNPYPTIDHQVDRPSSVFSNRSSVTSSQSQYSDYQITSNPPIQQSQLVYIQPTVQSDTPVEIREISQENNDISASPRQMMLQTSSTQYVLPPRVLSRLPERRVTPQNQMNVIERAYWDASQN
ncbi:uncharacterized protein LOC113501106 [Trichoplusia ni]|nr:uncharacterized protein LOC113501106 [Trichoplusia ni]